MEAIQNVDNAGKPLSQRRYGEKVAGALNRDKQCLEVRTARVATICILFPSFSARELEFLVLQLGQSRLRFRSRTIR